MMRGMDGTKIKIIKMSGFLTFIIVMSNKNKMNVKTLKCYKYKIFDDFSSIFQVVQ